MYIVDYDQGFTSNCSKLYMIGGEILVAPLHNPLETLLEDHVPVFLPSENDWVHLWTQAIYKGILSSPHLWCSSCSVDTSGVDLV